MRLRPGLNHNFIVMQHASLCSMLLQLKVDKPGKAKKAGKAKEADKPFKLPAAVVPMCNNSAGPPSLL